jgi:outer membrane protein TolC
MTHGPLLAVVFAVVAASALAQEQQPLPLTGAVAEALRQNPEIQAARAEQEAALQRIAPAGALDDPMLEAGVVNLPINSPSFQREDMTMKMIGLSQRLPYPGKRALREDVATKEAESLGHGYRETINRVTRDVKLAYFDLALALENTRLTERNRAVLEQLVQIVQSRYAVGQASQADALKAQTQVAKMTDELIKLARERRVIEAELNRALGRTPERAGLLPQMPGLNETDLRLDALREGALRNRPQLLAQQSVIEKNAKALELARKEYYPDFEVRFSYGQRDGMPTGERRGDMVSLTFAINLPVWRGNKLDPRVREAAAMREQALSMYQAQANEVASRLRQEVANAEQNLRSAQLYRSGILPQAQLTVESALSAYRVNRVDLMTLLDNQMTVFAYEISYATAVVNQNKALAEVEFITGRAAQ